MSIRGGFDRLTKEIDALTYNSRSVLNALIRSTVASGSSQGYTVTRAGVELTLTRVDIYRLYQFYQAWQANGFALVDSGPTSTSRAILGFDTIRIRQDETPIKTEDGVDSFTATTDALVSHSQILFLNTDTLGASSSTVIEGQITDNTNSTNYWLNVIKEFNDPKLLTNSAPIPINLRTPVFDENMGTATYNNHPTYLFPYQYFGMQLLGYPGDDTNHSGGGNSWTWDVDQYLRFTTPAFASGDVLSNAVYKTWDERNYRLNSQTGKPLENTYSTVWGLDTHARALYGTAGGSSSMVPRGADRAIAIGYKNLASAVQSVSIGGTINQAVRLNSGVYAGARNASAGSASFATNSDNVTGGATYDFTRPQSNATDVCLTDTSGCDTIASETGSQFGFNQIAILGDRTADYYTSDNVVVYAYTTYVADTNQNGQFYYDTNGDTFISVETQITSIAYIAEPWNINGNHTIITLLDDLPNPARIDGGRITRTSGVFGRNNTRLALGANSSVFGQNNYASGLAQTVVGKFNRPVVVDETTTSSGSTTNYRLNRFIVGSGTSDENRQNTLEVYDGRVVMYGRGNSIDEIPVLDADYTQSNFVGFSSDDERIVSIFEVNRIQLDTNGFTLEAYTGNTTKLVSVKVGSDNVLELLNYQASIQIKTGLSPSVQGGFTIDPLDIALVSKNKVIISGESDIIITSADNIPILLNSGGDLNFTWSGTLNLNGNTLNALPTNDKSLSHFLQPIGKGDTINFSDIPTSGFFLLGAGEFSSYPTDRPTGVGSGSSWFILNNKTSRDDFEDTMQLAWAAPDTLPTTVDDIGRPAIRKSDNTGNFTNWENLAFLRDMGIWSNITNSIETVFLVKDSGNINITTDVKQNTNTIVRMRDNYSTLYIDMALGFSDVPISQFDHDATSIKVTFTDVVPLFKSTDVYKYWDVNNAPAINTDWGNAGAILLNGTRTIEITLYDKDTGQPAEIDRPDSGAGPKLHDTIAFKIYSGLIYE